MKETTEHYMKCASNCLSMAKVLKAAAAEHEDHAEFFLSQCKAADGVDTHDDSEGTELKTAKNDFGMTAARDFKSAVPDHVHAVMPSDVPPAARLINRAGGAPFAKTDEDKNTEIIDSFAK